MPPKTALFLAVLSSADFFVSAPVHSPFWKMSKFEIKSSGDQPWPIGQLKDACKNGCLCRDRELQLCDMVKWHELYLSH
jgi:hypothetical protein